MCGVTGGGFTHAAAIAACAMTFKPILVHALFRVVVRFFFFRVTVLKVASSVWRPLGYAVQCRGWVLCAPLKFPKEFHGSIGSYCLGRLVVVYIPPSLARVWLLSPNIHSCIHSLVGVSRAPGPSLGAVCRHIKQAASGYLQTYKMTDLKTHRKYPSVWGHRTGIITQSVPLCGSTRGSFAVSPLTAWGTCSTSSACSEMTLAQGRLKVSRF